jgi:hypothetical protein
MKYFVWLEYYAAAPVSRNVKSDELKYADGHVHGVQPTQEQTDSRQASLNANVAAVYATYNRAHAADIVAAPADDAIEAARTVRTRSER